MSDQDLLEEAERIIGLGEVEKATYGRVTNSTNFMAEQFLAFIRLNSPAPDGATR